MTNKSLQRDIKKKTMNEFVQNKAEHRYKQDVESTAMIIIIKETIINKI